MFAATSTERQTSGMLQGVVHVATPSESKVYFLQRT